MKKLVLLIILNGIFLTACSTMNSESFHQTMSYREPVRLVAYHFDDRFIHIEVISKGCTFITSFELLLVDKKSNSIEVIRKKTDNCRVKPIKISLAYSYRHLGVDHSRTVNLVNPLFEQTLAARTKDN